MRANRLLSILLLLQAHGQMTGRELASRLEVSERTLHRDMEALSSAGVPVYALRGSRGGWQLDEDWRTQVPGLDEAELHALLMAQPRVIGNAKLVAAAERAFNKLMAALPGSLREQATSMRQRLFVDTNGWSGSRENLAMLPLVQDAVARDRKLSFQYQKTNGERSERLVDPLGLVAKGNTWYLVGRTGENFRTYRVSRIEQARILEQTCQRPADFDLAEYWKASTKEFQEGLQRLPATLHIEERASRWLRSWRNTTLIEPDRNREQRQGWITLRVLFEGEEDACMSILGMGSKVEVLEPAVLRKRILQEISAAAGQYAGR